MANRADLVSIVIPTLNREMPLRRALASLGGQVLPPDVAIEIIVVDNSRDRSASWVEAEFAGKGIAYLSEPVPGVANARNAGIRAASGRWVAFLDDDEEAGPDWIARHVEALRATGAAASFGPVEANAEEGGDSSPAFMAYFSRRIDRPDHADITDMSALLGTNNSVFERATCLSGDEVFDTSLNETGGEDSLLLRELVLSGKKFTWAARANVIEWVPPRRLNWSYVRRRRFLSGQIRTLVHHKLTPPRWAHIFFWMGAGTIQAVGWYAASLLYRASDVQKAELARSKAYGGLGKVFWGKRFGPKLYGSGLVS